jgi:hypothetical protein
MTTSVVLKIEHVANLSELISVLHRISANDLHQVDNDNVNVFGRTGEPVRVRLIEDTLTDGSVVLNINLE